MHEGQVPLLHPARLELRLQAPQRRLGLGHYQAPGGFLVEPMHDPGAELASDPEKAPDLVQEAVHHGARGDARPGMDGHSGRLVDDEEIAVLVQHREAQILGQELGGLGLGDPDLDLGAGPGTQRRLGGGARDQHGSVQDELLQPRARQLRKARSQDPVEAHPRLRRLDPQPDGLHHAAIPNPRARGYGGGRHQIADLMWPLRARMTSTRARSKKLVLAYSLGSTRLS